MHLLSRPLLQLGLGACLASCAALGAATYEPSVVVPPRPARELRGVWVASVSNIDWPSTNGLTTAQQKAELVAIMDTAVRLRLNTVIFQVRPSCDALYASSLEPWSEYLTGTMGKAPEPFYDPLAFAVQLAHERGLELHAWFNPYRARHSQARSPISSGHISRTKPHLVREYGSSLWLDPGEKAVQDYSVAVILDVVKRYDIDGVHIDDYFYPYKERDSSGRELDFPDTQSWKRFGVGSGLGREDWRRANVNAFVQRLYSSIKQSKPWVKFGISPFGIWRPGNPAQIRGLDAYEKLYADARKWLVEGWADYFAPQLYWAIEAPEQSFPVLLDWWADQNTKGRVVVPGLDSTKIPGRWPSEQIVRQIQITRKQRGASGHIHWNMRALTRNNGVAPALLRDVYSGPALTPILARAPSSTPGKATLTASSNSKGVLAGWTSPSGQATPWLWVLQTKRGQNWQTQLLPGLKTSWTFESPRPEVIAVTAVSRTGKLGRTAAVQRKN